MERDRYYEKKYDDHRKPNHQKKPRQDKEQEKVAPCLNSFSCSRLQKGNCKFTHKESHKEWNKCFEDLEEYGSNVAYFEG